MRFILNDRGVDQVVNGAKMTAYLNKAGAVVKSTVESQAAGFARTRRFSKSIRKNPVEQGPNGPRVTVHSTDWFAHGIEYGSINNVAYAPFRRAVASLGLKLEGGGERRGTSKPAARTAAEVAEIVQSERQRVARERLDRDERARQRRFTGR